MREDEPIKPGELSKNQAMSLVSAAAKAGVTPQREHLDIVFGPAVAVEILALIRRKNAAYGADMARHIATRKGETVYRTPSRPTEVDVEGAIREALAKIKINNTSAPRPAGSANNAEKLDPRAVLAEWEANRQKSRRGGHYIVEKADQNGPFSERVDAVTQLPIGRF